MPKIMSENIANFYPVSIKKMTILPTINIKGKEYVLVKDRILHFNETCPNGSIQTERISDGDKEIIKAIVIPDCDKPTRCFTWYSQAKRGDGYINQTSALENAETSAVGRALAMMGIGIIDSIASADEINKAQNQSKNQTLTFVPAQTSTWNHSGDKPWFNKPQYDELAKKENFIKTFASANELIVEVEKTYKVSSEKKAELTKLRTEKNVLETPYTPDTETEEEKKEACGLPF